MKGAETALECARRELYEETGIRLPCEIGYDTVKLSRNRDGNNSEYFRCQVDSEIPLDIVDKNEIGDGGWFSLPEIQRLEGNIDVTNFALQSGFPPVR
jgi:8-oxo-dGTP pyrophosphatase MutT (NUDIX family)